MQQIADWLEKLGMSEYARWDNPYDVGMTGLIGFSSGYYAMLDCDILLMLGTDFPYRHGSGCEGAHDQLVALGEKLKAPMVHALRGKEQATGFLTTRSHRPGRYPARGYRQAYPGRSWCSCCGCTTRLPFPTANG
jgi:hypothetical protein